MELHSTDLACSAKVVLGSDRVPGKPEPNRGLPPGMEDEAELARAKAPSVPHPREKKRPDIPARRKRSWSVMAPSRRPDPIQPHGFSYGRRHE